jgi:hypothetical protein
MEPAGNSTHGRRALLPRPTVAGTLVDRHQPKAAVQLELMVVRDQLRILQRQVKRPHLRPLTYFSFLTAEQAVS